jgi:alkanesulfonate monooxygenase SsuD/methylene tetrahydromethanopterin reductase-like flavin-dependent oxidoreductase (luciferase family)
LVVKHYELKGDHLSHIKGYEFSKNMQHAVATPEALEATIDFFLNLQVWGTPEQCYDKIQGITKRLGSDAFFGVFAYGGMPVDEAERNLRAFATTVMPELQKDSR